MKRFLFDPARVLAFSEAGLLIAAVAALAAFLLLVLALRRHHQWKRATRLARTAALGCAIIAFAAVALYLSVPRWIGVERAAVLSAMRARPTDPWPHSLGHVPLGTFGATETTKAYVEPGGSFSPAVGSFGLSIWIVDEAGALVTTSDSLSLGAALARYETSPSGEPAITVETLYYTATWTVRGASSYRLDLAARTALGQHIEVAVRSVGPAGGPLHRIESRDGSLHLGDVWTLRPTTSMRLTFLGEEGTPGWTRAASHLPVIVESVSGWAHARFSLPADGRLTLEVSGAPSPSPAWPTPQVVRKLDGVDPVFMGALDAQAFTLLQGLVGDETRPGDPVNYPLAWQRDASYVLVALARAGYLDVAKRLAGPIARTDFFGGFGAEADAPGLALWGLAETAVLANDKTFDESIWPDVTRKVSLIAQMLAATSEIRYAYDGPVVPKYSKNSDLTLVAGPSRGGLINGRMDWQRPVLFVNAVSYAGLRGGARIAERLGHAVEASQWNHLAERLQTTWRTWFSTPEGGEDAENDRTFVAGLWPTEVADPAAFKTRLDMRWRQPGTAPRPLWTYFTLAEAHQWLRLGRPDRVWNVLDLFWAHQPVPGLFTLWEGNTEENSFGIWKTVRGWVRPPNVNPHYWSAAEMLLLQLAMLAEVAGEPGSERLTIGAGVRPEWLEKPLRVSGIGTSHGFVDWTWHDGIVEVTAPGAPDSIVLGPNFPPGTVLKLRH